MNLYKITLTIKNEATVSDDDMAIHRALLGAWRELRLVADVAHQEDQRDEVWIVWGDSPAMVEALLRRLPLVIAGAIQIMAIEPANSSAAAAVPPPQPPHPGSTVVRQLRGLALDDVFPHYDNDDMGLEEKFHYMWDLCRTAEAAQSAHPNSSSVVKRLRQGVVAIARALAAYYDCDPALKDDRRAFEQRAVWLAEVGVDPEAALRLIRNTGV